MYRQGPGPKKEREGKEAGRNEIPKLRHTPAGQKQEAEGKGKNETTKMHIGLQGKKIGWGGEKSKEGPHGQRQILERRLIDMYIYIYAMYA